METVLDSKTKEKIEASRQAALKRRAAFQLNKNHTELSEASLERMQKNHEAAKQRKLEKNILKECRSILNQVVARVVRIEKNKEEENKLQSWKADGLVKYHFRQMLDNDDGFLVKAAGEIKLTKEMSSDEIIETHNSSPYQMLHSVETRNALPEINGTECDSTDVMQQKENILLKGTTALVLKHFEHPEEVQMELVESKVITAASSRPVRRRMKPDRYKN